jgi:predicted transposase YbfD/YdcC
MSTLPERLIAVDGKACRGPHLADQDGRALRMLNAFARDHNLMRSSVALAPGQNEPGALPAFLNSLHLEGSWVSVDAGGSTRPVAEAIRQGGADYLLSIKEHQPETLQALEQFFEWALLPNRPKDQHVKWTYAQNTDKAHGCIEKIQV